jgi:hypothetical protein
MTGIVIRWPSAAVALVAESSSPTATLPISPRFLQCIRLEAAYNRIALPVSNNLGGLEQLKLKLKLA